jgi:hypothetical protein
VVGELWAQLGIGLRAGAGQEGLADPAAACWAWGDGPQARSHVLDVFGERVVGAESSLDADERLGIALEGEEEEPGVELAEAVVEAVGEGVSAA